MSTYKFYQLTRANSHILNAKFHVAIRRWHIPDLDGTDHGVKIRGQSMQTVLFPGDLQVCGFAAYEGLICKFAAYEEILYKVEEFKCLESMLLE